MQKLTRRKRKASKARVRRPYRSKSKPSREVAEKHSSEKSKIPINLDDLIWDLEGHYKRISRIAKNIDTDEKIFPKMYVILKDLARALINIMELKGIGSGEESLAELLSRISNDLKQIKEVKHDVAAQRGS